MYILHLSLEPSWKTFNWLADRGFLSYSNLFALLSVQRDWPASHSHACSAWLAAAFHMCRSKDPFFLTCCKQWDPKQILRSKPQRTLLKVWISYGSPLENHWTAHSREQSVYDQVQIWLSNAFYSMEGRKAPLTSLPWERGLLNNQPCIFPNY